MKRVARPTDMPACRLGHGQKCGWGGAGGVKLVGKVEGVLGVITVCCVLG